MSLNPRFDLDMNYVVIGLIDLVIGRITIQWCFKLIINKLELFVVIHASSLEDDLG